MKSLVVPGEIYKAPMSDFHRSFLFHLPRAVQDKPAIPLTDTRSYSLSNFWVLPGNANPTEDSLPLRGGRMPLTRARSLTKPLTRHIS